MEEFVENRRTSHETWTTKPASLPLILIIKGLIMKKPFKLLIAIFSLLVMAGVSGFIVSAETTPIEEHEVIVYFDPY